MECAYPPHLVLTFGTEAGIRIGVLSAFALALPGVFDHVSSNSFTSSYGATIVQRKS